MGLEPKIFRRECGIIPPSQRRKGIKEPNRVTSQISRINGSIVLFHPMHMVRKREKVSVSYPSLCLGAATSLHSE